MSSRLACSAGSPPAFGCAVLSPSSTNWWKVSVKNSCGEYGIRSPYCACRSAFSARSPSASTNIQPGRSRKPAMNSSSRNSAPEVAMSTPCTSTTNGGCVTSRFSSLRIAVSNSRIATIRAVPRCSCDANSSSPSSRRPVISSTVESPSANSCSSSSSCWANGPPKSGSERCRRALNASTVSPRSSSRGSSSTNSCLRSAGEPL